MAHHGKAKKNLPRHVKMNKKPQVEKIKDDLGPATKQSKVDKKRSTTPAGTGEHNTNAAMQAAAAPRIKAI